MITLFNVNFVKHLVTNFRTKKAKVAEEKGEEYIDVTDFPTASVWVFSVMAITLMAVGSVFYRRQQDATG